MTTVQAFRLGIAVCRWLPEPLADQICHLIGWVGYRRAADTRATVLANLAHVLPEADASTRSRLARRLFYAVARNYYDLLRLPGLSVDRLAGCFTWRHRERLAAAIATGRGVIVVSLHLGNYSLVAPFAATQGIRATIINELLEPPALYDLITSLRGQHGVHVAPAGGRGLRPVLETLRQGGVLALAGDRDVTGTGIIVPFFGQPTTVPSGPASLALRTGALLVPLWTYRVARDHSLLIVEEPVPPVMTGDRPADIAATTERLLAVLERAIRTAPDQWAVLQPIWPTLPPRSRLPG